MPDPVLRYLGSKWTLADWIIEHLPPHDVYVEPFFGSGAVFFLKPRSRVEIVNDLNDDVVNLFEVVRDRPKDLARAVALTPYSREEVRRCCADGRDLDPVERARRFLVRCWQTRPQQGYGSEKNWRISTSLNGPLSDTWSRIPARIMAAAKRLKSAHIEKMDAIEVIKRYDGQETVFYVDPPYPRIVRDHPYEVDVPDDYHFELAGALNSVQGMAVLSSYRNQLYDRLFPGWVVVEKEGKTQANTPRVEALYISPRAWRELCRSRSQRLLPFEEAVEKS